MVAHVRCDKTLKRSKQMEHTMRDLIGTHHLIEQGCGICWKDDIEEKIGVFLYLQLSAGSATYY